MHKQLDAACRVALAGLVHELGDFAYRTGLELPKDAAALYSDVLARATPNLVRGEAYPFSQRQEGEERADTLVNVAGSYSNPKTFLQWLMATADCVASGIEPGESSGAGMKEPRKENLATQLKALLGEVSTGEVKNASKESQNAVLPLTSLKAKALFPVETSGAKLRDEKVAKSEYEKLWKEFSEALGLNAKEPIPDAFRKNWSLWIDTFDSLWLTFTSSIPSTVTVGETADVSLYDHSKATATLATALWLWHEANGRTDDASLEALRNHSDWDEKKFLLIQGDFFGIQNFIFSEGSETNKKSAKILRGRSFYVSLLSELAALKVLQTLELPSTSQILNAAGKFMIVAPNTKEVVEKLERIRKEFDAWFIKHTLAIAGMGLVWTEASCRDFTKKHYSDLTKRLFETMDSAKLQRFNLVSLENPILDVDYSQGVCSWQARLPADDSTEGEPTCALTRDEIQVGEALVKYKRVLILEGDAEIQDSFRTEVKTLELPIFGYKVAFAQDRTISGKFSGLAANLKLLRCWDFSLPASEDEMLWHGFARRNINGYVPHYIKEGFECDDANPKEGKDTGLVKQFSDIAKADSLKGEGLQALMAVKGDVDSLGQIFQKGLAGKNCEMNFAKTAGLSRQLNSFFAVWLPLICQKQFPNMYTVFSGGDDFFLIGPWKESQRFVITLNHDFQKYSGMNPEVHFSVGTALTKPGVPVRTLSQNAEEVLERAKSSGKNRIVLYGEVVEWSGIKQLIETEDFLMSVKGKGDASSSYLYGLFLTLDMIAKEKEIPEAALWRSRLYYNTTRLFERQGGTAQQRSKFIKTLLDYLEEEETQFRIPLTNVFYTIRKTR